MKYLSRDMRGATSVELLLLLIVFAVVSIFAVAMTAPIREDMKVNAIITDVLAHLTPEARTDYQVISAVESEFAKQNIGDLSPKNILVIRADTLFSVQKKYEVRRQLLGPVDVVMRFEKTFKP